LPQGRGSRNSGRSDAADQARPLPISISTLIRNRPPDSNPASLALASWRTGTPRRIGQREVYLRDGADACLDRFPILIDAVKTVLPGLSFDSNFPKPGADQQTFQPGQIGERKGQLNDRPREPSSRTASQMQASALMIRSTANRP
jgi:hypothetical protein